MPSQLAQTGQGWYQTGAQIEANREQQLRQIAQQRSEHNWKIAMGFLSPIISGAINYFSQKSLQAEGRKPTFEQKSKALRAGTVTPDAYVGAPTEAVSVPPPPALSPPADVPRRAAGGESRRLAAGPVGYGREDKSLIESYGRGRREREGVVSAREERLRVQRENLASRTSSDIRATVRRRHPLQTGGRWAYPLSRPGRNDLIAASFADDVAAGVVPANAWKRHAASGKQQRDYANSGRKDPKTGEVTGGDFLYRRRMTDKEWTAHKALITTADGRWNKYQREQARRAASRKPPRPLGPTVRGINNTTINSFARSAYWKEIPVAAKQLLNKAISLTDRQANRLITKLQKDYPEAMGYLSDHVATGGRLGLEGYTHLDWGQFEGESAFQALSSAGKQYVNNLRELPQHLAMDRYSNPQNADERAARNAVVAFKKPTRVARAGAGAKVFEKAYSGPNREALKKRAVRLKLSSPALKANFKKWAEAKFAKGTAELEDPNTGKRYKFVKDEGVGVTQGETLLNKWDADSGQWVKVRIGKKGEERVVRAGELKRAFRSIPELRRAYLNDVHLPQLAQYQEDAQLVRDSLEKNKKSMSKKEYEKFKGTIIDLKGEIKKIQGQLKAKKPIKLIQRGGGRTEGQDTASATQKWESYAVRVLAQDMGESRKRRLLLNKAIELGLAIPGTVQMQGRMGA